jgi:hypothetical protein
MKYLLLACVSTCLPAQELADRERMLMNRIEDLERRLAALEKKSEQSAETSAESQTVPAPNAAMHQTPMLPGDITMNVSVDG